MTPLQRITARVNRNGDVNDYSTPRPLLTLEEFFDGNSVAGSIWCNCTPTPTPADAFEILKSIRERPNVADVRVEITMFDQPEWPFSETVWVITTAASDEVKSWFPDDLAPDDAWSGFREGVRCERMEIPEGYQPVACWWD